MITEREELQTQNSFERIDASGLPTALKTDLKESIEEAKLNLNGRNLEDRVLSIAQTQFSQSRFLADILIMFTEKQKNHATGWKDVIIAVKWPVCVLGGIALVCSIFNTEIVNLLTAIVKLF